MTSTLIRNVPSAVSKSIVSPSYRRFLLSTATEAYHIRICFEPQHNYHTLPCLFVYMPEILLVSKIGWVTDGIYSKNWRAELMSGTCAVIGTNMTHDTYITIHVQWFAIAVEVVEVLFKRHLHFHLLFRRAVPMSCHRDVTLEMIPDVPSFFNQTYSRTCG